MLESTDLKVVPFSAETESKGYKLCEIYFLAILHCFLLGSSSPRVGKGDTVNAVEDDLLNKLPQIHFRSQPKLHCGLPSTGGQVGI